MDQRLKMKAQQNEQCLCKGRLEVAEGDENINIVMKNQFSALAADLEAKDKKIEEVAKEITEKEEALKQQEASYESLKKKLADKDNQLTTLKKTYEKCKKENAHNRKLSENVVEEQRMRINDLTTHINKQQEEKAKVVGINVYKKLLTEYKDLEEHYNQVKSKCQASGQSIAPVQQVLQPFDYSNVGATAAETKVIVDGYGINTTGLQLC